MTTKKKAAAPTKKAPSKTVKKAVKAQKAAQKTKAKTQVRTSRTTARATKASAAAKKSSTPSLSRWKEKHVGHAPQSARVTAPKGPVQPLAARTAFTPAYSDDRKWLVVDAANQTVGRLASQIAILLRGKHKPTFSPNNDAGDFVVVINAEKVKFTGAKEEQKTYNKHTGYIGGIKTLTVARIRREHPERLIQFAVEGMIADGPLGRRQLKKLKIYAGAQHPHTAQNAVVWNLRYNSIVE